eukprot:559754-Amphidinium_carterae.1
MSMRLLFDALRQAGDPEPDDADLERGVVTFGGYKDRKYTGNPLHFAAWRLTDKHPRGVALSFHNSTVPPKVLRASKVSVPPRSNQMEAVRSTQKDKRCEMIEMPP